VDDRLRTFRDLRTETKNATKAPTNPLKFVGEYLDPIGLYNLRARQYDPAIGRFTQPDPLTLEPYISPYVYANDRPTILYDPTGLAWCWRACGVVDKVSGGVGAVARLAGAHAGTALDATQVVACLTGVGCVAVGVVNAGYTVFRIYREGSQGDVGGAVLAAIEGFGPDLAAKGAVGLVIRTRARRLSDVRFNGNKTFAYDLRLTPRQEKRLRELGDAGAAALGLIRK